VTLRVAELPLGARLANHARAGVAKSRRGGYRFRFYAKDGDDLGVRESSEPNWKAGDTVALRDRIFRVYRVVYLDDGQRRAGNAETRGAEA
jgi:hypothetical protein